MATTFAEMLQRWDSNEGKPYKGRLIDFEEFESDPQNIGCMCAQGQVLHLLGGWSAKRLRDADQTKADKATAKLLNISVAHSILLRSINDAADGAPSIVLTHPEKILDRMKAKDWSAAGSAAWSAEDACSEIQGASILREQGRDFYFLPHFGFANPEAIPALPANYGRTA